MARQSEAKAPQALYHVTARAERREGLWADDVDRELFLAILGEVCDRFEWQIYGYCLLPSHYHLLIELTHPNLGQGVRQLHALYTRATSQRHCQLGPLFHARFGSMRIDRGRLLELNRHVVLSPVRAGLVSMVKDWPWSSYRATAGLGLAPSWLSVGNLLGLFEEPRPQAVVRYVGFVAAGLVRRPALELPPVLLGSPPPRTLAAHLRKELVKRRAG